jgi:hypothetical protein
VAHKAQLSFEFLIYVAISAVSLVGMMALYIKGSQTYSLAEGRAYAELFVAGVNSHMGYSLSSFVAYVPKGLCGHLFGGRALRYYNTDYAFAGNVTLDNSLCGSAGGMENITMYRSDNGTFTVG